MTVATTISEATFVYTGAETTFPTGFRALSAAHVLASLTTPAGETIALAPGVNYSVAIDGATGLATATRISFPAAAGTLRLWRVSDYVQDRVFTGGEGVPAKTHEDLHDAHVLRLQEVLRDIARVAAGGFNFDAAGPLAARATYNNAALNFVYLQTDDALGRPLLFVKLSAASGDWSSALQPSFLTPAALLPTTLPAQAGIYWNNGGVLCIS